MEEQLFTFAQVAKALGVARSTITHAARTNQLEYVKFGHSCLVTSKQLEDFKKIKQKDPRSRIPDIERLNDLLNPD